MPSPTRGDLPCRLASQLLIAILAAATFPAIATAQANLPQGASTVSVASELRPELNVQPGETRTHRLTLENTGSSPVLVDVTQADFRTGTNGEIAHEPADFLPFSNAGWLEVASQVEIPPLSAYSLPITVEVPTGVEPGTYWSLLFVQPADATTVEQQEGGEGVRTTVTVNFRFGVTLMTHVGEPSERQLLFRNPELTSDDVTDIDAVSVTVENPTRFLAAADVWLELYDMQGSLVREANGGTLRIYPESARRHTFELGALEDGTYQAVIVADAGDDAVFGVRYDLVLSDD